jgi:hypothetical protein
LQARSCFALIDPLDVAIFGHLRPSRDVLYAAGFFFFWLIAALSSMLTLFMQPNQQEAQNAIGF